MVIVKAGSDGFQAPETGKLVCSVSAVYRLFIILACVYYLLGKGGYVFSSVGLSVCL